MELGIKFLNFPIVAYLSYKSVPVSKVSFDSFFYLIYSMCHSEVQKMFFQVFFPAVTVCPDFTPYIPLAGEYRSFEFFRYKKHTITKHLFSHNEYLDITVDERRLNLSYTEILQRIENGMIDPNHLGMKM